MNLLALIIILLAIAFLLRIEFIYYIVYVCIGIYLIGRLYVPRSMRRLLAGREFNDHAFLGEKVDVQLRWQNRSRLPLPWLEFSDSVPPELRLGETASWAIALGGKESRTVTYQVQAGRRGYYRIGPARLTSGDLFGMVRPVTGLLEAGYLTVYPRIIPLVELGLPSRLPFGTVASRQRLFEDPARPAGVRDYRSGDLQRQINWKASAHAGSLLVRRYQPAISLEAVILLNLHSADYEKRDQRFHTEWAIVVAASLAVHLANRRQPVGLITNGVDPLRALLGDLPNRPTFDEESGRLTRDTAPGEQAASLLPPPLMPRSGRPHLMKILEVLARLESDETIALEQWAASACAPLSWGVTILVITAQGDEGGCQVLHRLVRSGFNAILIAVEPDLQFGKVRERARQLGFRAYHVLQSENLDIWRQPLGQLAR